MRYLLISIYFSLTFTYLYSQEDIKTASTTEGKESSFKYINQVLAAINLKATEEDITKFLHSITPTKANKKRVNNSSLTLQTQAKNTCKPQIQ